MTVSNSGDVVAAVSAMHQCRVLRPGLPQQSVEDASARDQLISAEFGHLLPLEVVDAMIQDGTARELLQITEECHRYTGSVDKLDEAAAIEDRYLRADFLYFGGIWGECERSDALILSVKDAGWVGAILQSRLHCAKPAAKVTPARPKDPSGYRLRLQLRVPSILDVLAEFE